MAAVTCVLRSFRGLSVDRSRKARCSAPQTRGAPSPLWGRTDGQQLPLGGPSQGKATAADPFQRVFIKHSRCAERGCGAQAHWHLCWAGVGETLTASPDLAHLPSLNPCVFGSGGSPCPLLRLPVPSPAAPGAVPLQARGELRLSRTTFPTAVPRMKTETQLSSRTLDSVTRSSGCCRTEVLVLSGRGGMFRQTLWVQAFPGNTARS